MILMNLKAKPRQLVQRRNMGEWSPREPDTEHAASNKSTRIRKTTRNKTSSFPEAGYAKTFKILRWTLRPAEVIILAHVCLIRIETIPTPIPIFTSRLLSRRRVGTLVQIPY